MKKIVNVIIAILVSILLMPEDCSATKKLIFATDPFPPYYYKEDGTTKGIQVELAKIVFSKMNTQFKIEFVPWKRALLMAESGKVDGIFGLRKTKERQSWLIYPEEPLMNITSTIFKRVDDPFIYDKISSLEGKNIGIIKGYTYGKIFDNSTLFKTEEVKNIRQNFLKLMAGRVDLVAGYRIVGNHILRNMKLESKVVPSPVAIHVTPLYIGFTHKPGNEKIVREFSNMLKEFKNTDECDEIMHKVGLPPEMKTPCK
ncbi:ABC transporter substrate-binding protein [Desulfovibrio sp. JC022]|uniref:substrate-binding periplasmic protein n=1 Tax=Desulfovibrio sp. JC022 TaxID=2593642 RepID=UPI0013D6ADD9|nr:transporter substrate-binding domain-containing protein [Desulfovibrio sp. JC022]NDV23729.1 transporter substrate-binding domain-containing protein [Desulfovibrio sp. JC022]